MIIVGGLAAVSLFASGWVARGCVDSPAAPGRAVVEEVSIAFYPCVVDLAEGVLDRFALADFKREDEQAAREITKSTPLVLRTSKGTFTVVSCYRHFYSAERNDTKVDLYDVVQLPNGKWVRDDHINMRNAFEADGQSYLVGKRGVWRMETPEKLVKVVGFGYFPKWGPLAMREELWAGRFLEIYIADANFVGLLEYKAGKWVCHTYRGKHHGRVESVTFIPESAKQSNNDYVITVSGGRRIGYNSVSGEFDDI
jgi:hypothetical protein